MSDKLETVAIDMVTGDRLRLSNQIYSRMEQMGFNAYDYKSLNLGFELPASWPADIDSQPTLAQLVVLAHKLKMRLVISNLDLVARKDG